jgi:hypothetical protein
MNGNFSLSANRKDIRIDDEKNKKMISDTLPGHLMHHLKLLKPYLNKKCFYGMWPLHSALFVKDPWDQFLVSFYQLLKEDREGKLFYSEAKDTWTSFSDAKILVGGTFFAEKSTCYGSILKVLPYLDIFSVIIPERYQQDIKEIDFRKSALSALQFFTAFFSQVSEVDVSARDAILLKMIKSSRKDNTLTKFLEKPCVPCSGSRKLKKACALIDPDAPFACLFREEDEFFPAEEFRKDIVIAVLKRRD